MDTIKTAVIIGAGPAGLTAAYELLAKTDIKPVIYELSGEIGGISKTVNYKGNRLDIGGHRFFSKIDRIVTWWTNILPMQGAPSRDYKELGICVPLATNSDAPDPEQVDGVFLIRRRISRIYFLRRFFDYPILLSINTITNLGIIKCFRIAISYLRSLIMPIRNEKSLEDFFINRFGRQLYLIFFKDYTEKVWGAPCNSINSDWGTQRVKGLSISKTLIHSLRGFIQKTGGKRHKDVETSLIDEFMYPKLGPGQFWEKVATEIADNGGKLHLHSKVVGIQQNNGQIVSVTVRNFETGVEQQVNGDFFFSSMPVKDLIAAMDSPVPSEVNRVASGLKYRDFLTVGLLVDRLSIENQSKSKTINNLIPDNWIYVQERDVKLGRIQIFNNWSPYLVQDPDKVWLGLEYFCQEDDTLWTTPDSEMIEFAGKELEKIGIIQRSSIRDGVVIRVPKAYPAYFDSYNKFECIRRFTDDFSNLFLIGRNGMHRYNNMDHSMMTAIIAVENLTNNRINKDNIWQVNTEVGYHEAR